MSLGRTLLGAMAFRGWLLENNITGGKGLRRLWGILLNPGNRVTTWRVSSVQVRSANPSWDNVKLIFSALAMDMRVVSLWLKETQLHPPCRNSAPGVYAVHQ